jgi:hypothetical protein
MLNNKIIKYALITGWGLLGCKRGINSYDYKYKKYNQKKEIQERDTYFYSTKLFYSICGIVTYVNPFLFPITIPKEIYRLEVNIRGIENEQNSDYYNELI